MLIRGEGFECLSDRFIISLRGLALQSAGGQRSLSPCQLLWLPVPREEPSGSREIRKESACLVCMTTSNRIFENKRFGLNLKSSSGNSETPPARNVWCDRSLSSSAFPGGIALNSLARLRSGPGALLRASSTGCGASLPTCGDGVGVGVGVGGAGRAGGGGWPRVFMPCIASLPCREVEAVTRGAGQWAVGSGVTWGPTPAAHPVWFSPLSCHVILQSCQRSGHLTCSDLVDTGFPGWGGSSPPS